MIDTQFENCHEEIKEKVDFWHSRLRNQLMRFNDHANYWRLIRPSRAADLSGFSNPQVTETMRATEAIATFMYRGMTSAMPNFAFTSTNPNISQEDLWTSEQLIIWQQNATMYRRKLLKACRSVALFGTVAVEEPWIMNLPYYESTDFVPRSLLQMAFDPMAFDISQSGWHATIEYVTADQLRDMAKRMPDVWDPEAIEAAIETSKDPKSLSPEVQDRLSKEGYMTYSGGSSGANSGVIQLVNYYGPIKSNPGVEMCISTVNDLKVVRCHESVYRRRPFVFAHLNEFELEPYGYGVGRIAEACQPDINANQGRMHDTIMFSLFNMWLVNRTANVKSSQTKIRPWQHVEVDGDPETAMKAIRPQLEGVNFGMLLDKMQKEEFRSTTGASDNLQAMVTEASATESSIAQNEAVRRLSVITENVSETLLREHISKMHENNIAFLDQAFSIAATGRAEQVRVYPASLAPDVEVTTKIVTDKDFRPQRNKDLLQFLQVVTSIRNQNPQMGQVNLAPFVEEFARGVGMNPKLVWSSMPAIPGMDGGGQIDTSQIPTAMDKVGQMMEGVRQNAGALGAQAQESAAAAGGY